MIRIKFSAKPKTGKNSAQSLSVALAWWIKKSMSYEGVSNKLSGNKILNIYLRSSAEDWTQEGAEGWEIMLEIIHAHAR